MRYLLKKYYFFILYQLAVDIFKGIPDVDARYLAHQLEFKGPLVDQVWWKKERANMAILAIYSFVFSVFNE